MDRWTIPFSGSRVRQDSLQAAGNGPRRRRVRSCGRHDVCLNCHRGPATLGVPGFFVARITPFRPACAAVGGEGRSCNDAQRAFGTDKPLLQIVAGIVPDHRVHRIEHRAIRKNHLKSQDLIPRGDGPDVANASRVGSDNSANLARTGENPYPAKIQTHFQRRRPEPPEAWSRRIRLSSRRPGRSTRRAHALESAEEPSPAAMFTSVRSPISFRTASPIVSPYGIGYGGDDGSGLQEHQRQVQPHVPHGSCGHSSRRLHRRSSRYARTKDITRRDGRKRGWRPGWARNAQVRNVFISRLYSASADCPEVDEGREARNESTTIGFWPPPFPLRTARLLSFFP